EPAAGCYSAVRPPDEANLREYDSRNNHTVYLADYELGGEVPEEFILSCIAAQATPMIILRPPSDKKITVLQLYSFAKWLGRYNLPMFVAIFPVEPDLTLSADMYAVYYKHAHTNLNKYAPLAAAVWLADANKDNSEAYYPGHDKVDWVGFTCQSGFAKKEPGITEKLEAFYMKYQHDKPVILGPFGVSHFSDTDFTYYTAEAADELRRIYAAVRDGFPRVKMIAYADVNLIPSGGHDDFSFSQDDELRQAYADAAGDAYFSINLDTRSDGSDKYGWLRGGEAGYFIDGQAYIGAKTKSIGMEALRPDHSKRLFYVYANN
ncbi:MAG: hypothetical protein LBS19_16875, partial [Clostridiales bacterium]|nr:hypothetical protein [Clostridiales bacterium]